MHARRHARRHARMRGRGEGRWWASMDDMRYGAWKLGERGETGPIKLMRIVVHAQRMRGQV
eukprot:3201961-Pleurochrysis_carterae.AAC.1